MSEDKEAISHTPEYQVAKEGWTIADIERDRRYEERIRALETNTADKFRASEIAVNAALASQEKATAAAFVASEKAITKAEDAQRAYNERSNEFRSALDDAVKNQISRIEADGRFRSQDEKFETYSKTVTQNMDELKKEIAGLRESRQGYISTQTVAGENKQSSHWATTAVISGIGVFLSLISVLIVIIVAVSK